MAQTITGRLSQIERLEASNAGNPRWQITIDGSKQYKTAVNASVNYAVDNHRVGRPVPLTIDAGQVIDMEYAP